ncbi:hypothetical protein PTKIN_Ptkin11bG0155900 [Pterospermum kingtungense]
MSKQAKVVPYLPEEILVQILYKPNVKSLGRFMCVSKAWNSIIKNPYFVSTHLHVLSKYSSNNNLFLVITNETQLEYSLHFDDQEFSKSIDVELHSLNSNSWKILDPPNYDLHSHNLMVFVNGVVHCISCDETVINDNRRMVEFVSPYVLNVWVMKKKNWGFIFDSHKDPGVVLHDLESNEINNFGTWGRYLEVCSYTESLVLLGRVIDAGSENGALSVSNGSSYAEDCTSTALSETGKYI